MLREDDRTALTAPQGPVIVPGMRRVRFVRILVGDGRTSCQAVGTGHRLPTVLSVSLDVAAALAASGVPSVIRSAEV